MNGAGGELAQVKAQIEAKESELAVLRARLSAYAAAEGVPPV